MKGEAFRLKKILKHLTLKTLTLKYPRLPKGLKKNKKNI